MHTRTAAWLRHRLGRAVVLSYVLALFLPGPGLWLRRPRPLPPAHLTLHTAPLLLSLVLFSAGLQVPVRALGALVRRPKALLAGLVLHFAIPLAVVPFVALLLRCTPDADGGSGLLTAVILVVAMPVAAGATVWTGQGGGDQPTMVGLVLASTLLSPLTTPVLLAVFSPLVGGGYAAALADTGRLARGGFALTAVVLPCAAGLLGALLLPARQRGSLIASVAPAAMVGSLVLTYVNASGALRAVLTRPRPLLFAAALGVAALVCLLSYLLGRAAARALRLEAGTASSLTLACGMNNSSASAVLITASLPDKPHLLLPVLAYGLLQKSAAHRIVTRLRAAPAAGGA
ncbi:sodium-dependent transporter [Streptomyces longwoodensis]|uniref:sodium-dependent transporter n=1 Tax=Streptomyces longwoodensis TaxID=68231 RepID=UPI0033A48091